MKKILALLLVVVMFLSLVACSSSNEQINDILQVGDTASTDKVEFILKEIKLVNSSTVSAQFSIRNIGKESLSNTYVTFGDGFSTQIMSMRLNYNNGYLYKFDSMYNTSGNYTTFYGLEPLSAAQIYKMTVTVPVSVTEGSEELLLEVALPYGSGNTKIFTYQVDIHK